MDGSVPEDGLDDSLGDVGIEPAGQAVRPRPYVGDECDDVGGLGTGAEAPLDGLDEGRGDQRRLSLLGCCAVEAGVNLLVAVDVVGQERAQRRYLVVGHWHAYRPFACLS